jgi:hypothetical protein
MAEVELCPPWWPQLLWDLLHKHGPPPPPDDGLSIIDDLLISLHTYVTSYRIRNKDVAKQIRKASEQELGESLNSIKNLDRQ